MRRSGKRLAPQSRHEFVAHVTRTKIRSGYLTSMLRLRTIRVPAVRFYSSKFTTEYTPGPPKLPKEQQEEFEALQRIASSQAAIDDFNAQIKEKGYSDSVSTTAPNLAKTDIGGFHPQYFKTIPEFEGDVNPVTGEKGGPKQDPLKHKGDWSFNGRVTDF